jgi:hypothetical protein
MFVRSGISYDNPLKNSNIENLDEALKEWRRCFSSNIKMLFIPLRAS